MRTFTSKILLSLVLVLGVSSFGTTAKAVTMQVGDLWRIDFTLPNSNELLFWSLSPAAAIQVDLFASNNAPWIFNPFVTPCCFSTVGGSFFLPSNIGYALVQILSAPNGASDVTMSAKDPFTGLSVGTFTYSQVNAVPLPAALPLFASGLAGLAWLARRRKRMPAADALAVVS